MHILWYQINGSVALRLALLWPCLSGVVTSRCSCLGEVLITALAQSSSGGIAVCTSSFIGMTSRWHITANGPIYKISNSLSWNLLGAKFWGDGEMALWHPLICLCWLLDFNKLFSCLFVRSLGSVLHCVCCTMRSDTRCYFNVRSKADMSSLNLPHAQE